MSANVTAQEKELALRKGGVRATPRDVIFDYPGLPFMTIPYWEYTANGAPNPDLGDRGDVYVDLSDNLLYAKLLGGWTQWHGVTSPSGASSSRMVTWTQFKKWLVRNPTSVNECLPPHSTRYLWCTQEGVHWWTRAQITADRNKILDFPPDAKLRANGRWIVHDFVNSGSQPSAPENGTNANKSASSRKRTRDDESRGNTSGNSKADARSSVASGSGASASVTKRQRVEDSSTLNRVSKDSLNRTTKCVQDPRIAPQAPQEDNESTLTLKNRLEETRAELQKARAHLAAPKTEYLSRERRIQILEAELKKARDTAQKQEQALKDAQKHIAELVLVQQQALQLLEGNS